MKQNESCFTWFLHGWKNFPSFRFSFFTSISIENCFFVCDTYKCVIARKTEFSDILGDLYCKIGAKFCFKHGVIYPQRMRDIAYLCRILRGFKFNTKAIGQWASWENLRYTQGWNTRYRVVWGKKLPETVDFGLQTVTCPSSVSGFRSPKCRLGGHAPLAKKTRKSSRPSYKKTLFGAWSRRRRKEQAKLASKSKI